MRAGIVVGGTGVMVIAAFCMLAPLFDGQSVLHLGEQCRMVQPVAGLVEGAGLQHSLAAQCDSVHRIMLAGAGAAGAGAAILAVGAAAKRRPKAGTVDQR